MTSAVKCHVTVVLPSHRARVRVGFPDQCVTGIFNQAIVVGVTIMEYLREVSGRGDNHGKSEGS